MAFTFMPPQREHGFQRILHLVTMLHVILTVAEPVDGDEFALALQSGSEQG